MNFLNLFSDTKLEEINKDFLCIFIEIIITKRKENHVLNVYSL